MPKRGERQERCKRGHDLTKPDARRPPSSPATRGGGDCRLCVLHVRRTSKGSMKTGPGSRYSGDEEARLAALAEGKKRCPRCAVTKDRSEYSRDSGTPDGLGCNCRQCRTEQKRIAYQVDSALIRDRALAARFGFTVQHLQRLRFDQGDGCAICGRPCPTGKRLALDHDHTTGAARGFLCANCNRALGLLRDSQETVLAAAAYLGEWASAEGQVGVLDTGLPGST